jgi:hypothetical protein
MSEESGPDPKRLNVQAVDAGDATGFALFDTIDHNGDGVVCVKTEPAGSDADVQPHWAYAYNFVDDNSSAATG